MKDVLKLAIFWSGLLLTSITTPKCICIHLIDNFFSKQLHFIISDAHQSILLIFCGIIMARSVWRLKHVHVSSVWCTLSGHALISFMDLYFGTVNLEFPIPKVITNVSHFLLSNWIIIFILFILLTKQLNKEHIENFNRLE